MTKPTPVVIDCDPGSDDVWAIITLLKSEEKFNIKVLGITVVSGNTSVENGSRNALLALKRLNRLDVPVFVGAESGLILAKSSQHNFFGSDGLSDLYDDKPGLELAQPKHAVDALRGIIEEHQNEIVVLAIGPLTNIALLYKMFPGISPKVKKLYIMGGNHKGQGNVSSCAECNFWNDPEAAHIVLTESKCPIFILPWETCLEASPPVPYKEWRSMELSSNNNWITSLLNPVEDHLNVVPCDVHLACCFLLPHMVKVQGEYYVTVELAGNHTRGQMLVDQRNRRNDNKPNAFVFKEIDGEVFKRFLMWICEHDIDESEFTPPTTLRQTQ